MKFHFARTEPFPGVTAEDWNSWTWQFKNGLSRADQFAQHFELSATEQEAFRRAPSFQVRSTPYYVALADRKDQADPVRRMLLPRLQEFEEGGQQISDPLGERKHSPRERLIHRYPDRILFLVTDQCSLYCRYCLRKHFTGQDQAFIGSKDYLEALEYIRRAPGVREIIISGGDPLTLGGARLDRLLFDLRSIEHVEILRIGTRMPVVCPMRLTQETVKMFRKYKPVFLMTHFNHPRELSLEAAAVLEDLVDHGVPVMNQMVLLNGINNHAAIVQALSRRLLFLRVKPYYMFQCDPSPGTEHFRTSVDESLAIQRELWGRLSGLALPNLSLDIPGGGGKVPLVPNFEVERSETARQFEGWDGLKGDYADPVGVVPGPPADLDRYVAEWDEIKRQPYGQR